MSPRRDILTASRVDLAIILLPLVGQQEAAKMLARHLVPFKVAVRVLTRPKRRRS